MQGSPISWPILQQAVKLDSSSCRVSQLVRPWAGDRVARQALALWAEASSD